MKKIFKLLICIMLLPLNILACPHVDSEGRPHLQTYNSDYTEMDMLYPQDGYLYVRNVTMTTDSISIGAQEVDLLKETYSFPICQDNEIYLAFYWFLDESLTQRPLEELDVETDVENTTNIKVTNDTYQLDVYFEDTYHEGMKYKNEFTEQIFYDVTVDKINDDQYLNNIIDSNELTVLSNDILDISFRFNIAEIIGMDYKTDYPSISSLHDKVYVTMKSETDITDIVAINLKNKINVESNIEVTKTTDDLYTFEISEPGMYILTERVTTSVEDSIDLGIQDEVETLTPQINEEEENNNLIYIIIGVSLLITITTGIIIYKVKKKNT